MHEPWIDAIRATVAFIAMLLASVTGDSPSSTFINVVEARGETYPSSPAPDPLPSVFDLPYLLGGAERQCVEANNSTARSGDWVIWPYGYASYWRPDREMMKVGWQDLHPARDPSDAPMTVRATKLSPPFTALAWSRPRYSAYGDSAEGGTRTYFYITPDLILPSLGTWVLEVTSRKNWGCFVIVLDEIAPVERPGSPP